MRMECPPPGFRFYPTEEELVSFYLMNKLDAKIPEIDRVIPVLDIYEFNPFVLPKYAGELCKGDKEQWFFFIPRQERECLGGRPNRLTTQGYWKATGSPGYVFSSQNRIIGAKRIMVFYTGRAPNGKKTKWKMNEYKAIDGEASATSTGILKLREEFSLYRVYIKSKCLRAFDRRPPPAMLGVEDHQAAATTAGFSYNNHHEAASTSNHDVFANHPQRPEIISRSQDQCSSFSSEDHAIADPNPKQSKESTVEKGCVEVDNIDNWPIWDWEEKLNHWI